ncbi:MAG: hypothetical protein M0024_10170 [Nitrospiraceae bacterium]|nr:hypothetical protein [Nitrospiraceae bacterium]
MTTMKAEYAAFGGWLSERDMIDRHTTAYKRVREAIDTMDRAMVRGDVKGFLEAVRNAKYSYIEAEEERTTNEN